MQTNDLEPLYILYSDAARDIEDANLDLVLQALIRLVTLGFSRCLQKKHETWRPCKAITLEDLKKRFVGLSDQEKKEYPMNTPEYYFEITEKGREEEAKQTYDAYYT